MLQVIEAQLQRDDANAALAAALLKLHEVHAARNETFDSRQERVSLEPQTAALQSDSQTSIIDTLKAEAIQLQALLTHSQEQHRQQIVQHEQQCSLLQLSCQELEAEAASLRASVADSRFEAELLRARVAEVEVSCYVIFCSIAADASPQAMCDDLRLDKVL
jgi:hypothetical protein